MSDSSERARLIIDFGKGGRAAVERVVGWLREEDPPMHQPFGADVNAFVYAPGDDDIECPEENVFLLVPGTRLDEHEGEPLLPPPGPPASARRGAGRHRPRGGQDQLFAPHGTSGDPQAAPHGGTAGRGVTQVAPY